MLEDLAEHRYVVKEIDDGVIIDHGMIIDHGVLAQVVVNLCLQEGIDHAILLLQVADEIIAVDQASKQAQDLNLVEYLHHGHNYELVAKHVDDEHIKEDVMQLVDDYVIDGQVMVQQIGEVVVVILRLVHEFLQIQPEQIEYEII